ncbi:T9SS type A sorting domain-containing protein [Hanstruepera ponticola]|uniref:T9SS type A sorting domain-containing protein n=1 Tax=Hanstruepera ponticola TaxID=2042995 RepID=UPI001783A7DE|nr:T9SS type A sorting domain-containing protein [Hanstruepera ponticola]
MKKTYLFILITLFYANISSSQSLDWVNSLGGLQDEIARDLAVDTFGNIYIVGQFRDTVDFDPGSGTVNQTSNGNADVFILKLDNSGAFIWVRTFGGTGADNATAIKVEDSGSIVVVGNFNDTVDFDPSAGNATTTSNGANDSYLLKMSDSGNYQFHRTFGGSGNDFINDIVVDYNNDYIVTGKFVNTVDFDPSAGVLNFTSGSTESDIFVMKISWSSGSLIWAKQFIGNSTTRDSAGTSIGVDLNNNVFIGGYYAGTVDFDPNAGVANESSTDLRNIFISKLNQNGNFVFVKVISNDNRNDRVRDIKLDYNNNILAVGDFQGTNVDFDPGSGISNLSGNGATNVPFLLKLNNNGDFVWAKEFKPLGSVNNGFAVAVDPSNNAYVSGQYSIQIDLDPGPNTTNAGTIGAADAFMVKLNEMGDFVWGKRFGGANNDTPYAMKFINNKIYQVGRYNGTADFDPEAPNVYETSNGGYDFFVQRISENTLSVSDFTTDRIKIFPNPTPQYIVVDGIPEFNYEIVSLEGKLIMKGKYVSNQIKIDVSGLVSGIYIIEINSLDNDQKIIHKIIKQ